MKNLIIAAAIIVFTAILPLNAFANSVENLDGTPLAEAQDEVSVSVDYTAWSQYHLSDGNVADEDMSHQLNLTVSSSSGWYGGVWVATDFDNVTDFGDEVDFYAGYAGENFDVGAQYFVLNNIGDVVNVYASASLGGEFAILTVPGASINATPSVKLDHYVSTDGSLDDGTIIRLAPNFTINGDQKVSFGLNPEINYDTGAFGNPDGLNAFVNGSANYRFENGVTASLLARHSAPLDGNAKPTNTSFAVKIAQSW